MNKYAWILGGIAACLLCAPPIFAQTRGTAYAERAAGVRPASYCSSCAAGGGPVAAPMYPAMIGGPCESCAVPACGRCGQCGCLVRELFCDVRNLVDASVGRVVRCLLPCGLVCPTCSSCGPPACGPVTCAGCGAMIPPVTEASPMLEPIPSPAIKGQPDPFRDDPVSTSRMMPRSRPTYYPSAASQPPSGRARQASYSAPLSAPELDRYRPQHTNPLRRTSGYSTEPSGTYR